jgi:hypothetical protein
MILTISDGVSNGKGGNYFVIFDLHDYIYNCKIVDNSLFIKNKEVNLIEITCIIFNYNEDLFTYNLNWDSNLTTTFKNINDMIQHFKDIANLVKRYYPKIIIYQDPDKCFNLGNKTLTFNAIKDIQNTHVKCPLYKKIINLNDLDDVNFFPCIIKEEDGSATSNDTLCATSGELLSAYNSFFLNKKNIICIQYIDSTKNSINKYCSIRLMVTNDNLVDYYCRVSDMWKINNICNDHTIMYLCKADQMFQEYYNTYKLIIDDYIKKIHAIYGNGFFAYDLILSDNILYVCEIGLKIYNSTFPRVVKEHNIQLNKKTLYPPETRAYFIKLMSDMQVNNKPIIFCDIDFTISDSMKRLKSNTNNLVLTQNAFSSNEVMKDLPYKYSVEANHILMQKYRIYFLTARGNYENAYDTTKQWLDTYNFHYDKLIVVASGEEKINVIKQYNTSENRGDSILIDDFTFHHEKEVYDINTNLIDKFKKENIKTIKFEFEQDNYWDKIIKLLYNII